MRWASDPQAGCVVMMHAAFPTSASKRTHSILQRLSFALARPRVRTHAYCIYAYTVHFADANIMIGPEYLERMSAYARFAGVSILSMLFLRFRHYKTLNARKFFRRWRRTAPNVSLISASANVCHPNARAVKFYRCLEKLKGYANCFVRI